LKGFSVVRLELLEFINSLISIVLVYAIVVTLAGWFRAWVAYKVGDDTPAALGFLSLNPIDHLDPFGALLFAWMGFGWGKMSPLNGAVLLHKKHSWLRIALANYADVIALMLLSFIMLTVQLCIVGVSNALTLLQALVSFRTAMPNIFFIFWPQLSTLAGTIGNIALLVTRLSMALGSIYFFMRSLDVAELVFPRFGFFMQSLPVWGRMLITFVVLIFGSSLFYKLMIELLLFLSSGAATLIVG
jgi:hypothetical protein